PLAVQLVALQLEQQLAFLESLPPILERYPFPAVPDDHTAGAVVARGDDPLEIAVLERVILAFDRQPFVVGVVRRTLGYRPRAEDTVHLETQVEVQLSRRVLVHHEQVTRYRRHRPERLRRAIRGSLGAVGAEAVGLRRYVVGTCHVHPGQRNFRGRLLPFPYSLALMPARPIAAATISFGLVSVPVNLYSSSESKASVSFNMLHKKCGSRLKQQYVCSKDGDIVPRDETV